MGGRGASASKAGSKITTQSGTYTASQLKQRDNKIMKMYNDAWNGKMSYAELNNQLEKMVENGQVSRGELRSIQYQASQSKSNITQLNNKQNVLDYVKQQLKIDLNKAVDNNRFSSQKGSRTYLDIDSRKLNTNEFNAVRKLLQYDKGLRFESNGAYNYAIYYKKK